MKLVQYVFLFVIDIICYIHHACNYLTYSKSTIALVALQIQLQFEIKSNQINVTAYRGEKKGRGVEKGQTRGICQQKGDPQQQQV